jgi:hypothetical protein
MSPKRGLTAASTISYLGRRGDRDRDQCALDGGSVSPLSFCGAWASPSPRWRFFDMVPVAQSEAVRAFQREHLFPASGNAFSYVPMGFTPFAMEIEGTERYFVWQIVVGDFAAFVEAKRQALTEDAFPTAELILQEALS